MKRSNRKNIIKGMAVSALAVCVSSGIFTAVNEMVFATSLEKTETVDQPTQQKQNYPEQLLSNQGKTEYVKAEFKVKHDKAQDLAEISKDALSAEQAAEIGAKYLWEMFQANLTGRTIEMFYFVDLASRKGVWLGDIYMKESDKKDYIYTYRFCIDAVTGVPSDAQYYPSLDQVEPLEYDEKTATDYYQNNCNEFKELAKRVAEKYIPGIPLKAEFVSLEPDIMGDIQDVEDKPGVILVDSLRIRMLVTAENGEQVEADFDVQTKSLRAVVKIYQGVIYDTGAMG
jgi:hypothetical protein